MTVIRCLLALVFSLGICDPDPPAAPPAKNPPDVKLQAFPSSIHFERFSDEVSVTVLLRNNSEESLEGITFTGASSLPAKIDLDPAQARLAPHQVLPERLRIHLVNTSLRTGDVQVLVQYSWKIEKTQRTDLATVSIPVTVSDTFDLSKAASIEIQASDNSIYEQQPGLLHLNVRNLSDRPLAVESVTAWGPVRIDAEKVPGAKDKVEGFVNFAVPGKTTISQPGPQSLSSCFQIGETLAPQHSLSLPMYVTVPGRLQPGALKLVFQTAFAWNADHRRENGSLLASQNIQIGILGESDVFKYLGAPSLLLLPGCLMILTCAFLWTIGIRIVKSVSEFPLKPTDGTFWLFAIMLSVITAWFCRLVGMHDYLQTHSYVDLSFLYFWSVVVAIAAYVALLSIVRLHSLILKGRQISTGDSAIVVIGKLDRLGVGLLCEPIDVNLRGRMSHGFLLERVDGDVNPNANYVVAPHIRIRFVPQNGNETSIDGWKSEIRDQLRHPTGGRGRKIVELLEQAGSSATVDWKYDQGWLDRPYQVLGSAITFPGGDHQLIETED